MVFLFSLINISFTLFFFLFWQYIESILFWILSIIFIGYFSKILSFFVEKKENPKNINQHNKKIFTKFTIEYFKKSSYYIATLLFYISLYWFIYSINLIYNFSNFFEIFHYITFSISLVIGIFFFFLKKRNETIFLIFRSNCVIFTSIYSCFLFLFLFKNITLTLFFIINSILPIITLFSVLIFDTFLKERKVYIYNLFLFYIFLVTLFLVTLIFPSLSLWYIFLGVVSFFMIIYTFIFPYIIYFNQFKYITQNIGVSLWFSLSFFILFSFLFNPISFFYLSILGISLFYHYKVYELLKNYIAYSIFLLTYILLYIKLFLILWYNSFISYILFIFLLPYLYIGIGYILYIKASRELYILNTIGITFSIVSFIYYFIQRGSIYDILSLSTILFFESILLFLSYVQLKK